MAKQRHQQTQETSKTPLIALAIGGLLVAALIVWALTRTVDSPATASIDAPSNQTQTFPTATTATTTVAPTGTEGFTPPPATFSAPNSAPIATTSNPALNIPEHAQTPDKAAVKRMSAEDLKLKVDSGQAVVIDVRDPNSYAAGHIKGALHIPMASVQANLDRLPKEKDVVAYCTWPNEESSAGAALILQNSGYKNVYALYGGLDAWRNLGYPTETGAAQ